MNDKTYRRERFKSDLIDLLLRVRDVLGGLLILLLGIAVLALNVLDALGVINHSPLLQKLYWPLILISLGGIGFILLREHLHRRRERREARRMLSEQHKPDQSHQEAQNG